MRRRLRAPLLLAFTAVLTAPAGPARAGGEDYRGIGAIDNVFEPRVVRIPVGGEVRWTNDGRTLHNVTADDGSFASGDLGPGETFEQAFPTQGAFPFHCSLHGAPGVGMIGLVLVGDVPVPSPGGAEVGPGRETPPGLPGDEIRVPQDQPTVQAAVDAAEPGGIVLISPGVYEEAVVVTTPFLTIRGLDRNETILDGGFALDNRLKVIE